MDFDFSKVTAEEMDNAMESGRYSKLIRATLAKVCGKAVTEINQLPADEYNRLVSRFLRAAYAPVSDNPN